MVLLVSCYKCVYVVFYANSKIAGFSIYLPQRNVVFARNDPAHVSYTKCNIFVHVVFIISMQKVSKFET